MISKMKENIDSNDKRKKEEPSVPLLRLFSFADRIDCVLLFFGIIAALAHGATLPASLWFFGKLVNAIGAYQDNPLKMAEEVGRFARLTVYVGIAAFLASWAEIACWMHAGERQATKMRLKYLNAILREDVGFFDTDGNSGMLTDSVSTDPLLVQDAISEKAGNCLHYMATFVGCFVVGFLAAWRLCLVTLAAVPAIAFAGGLYAYTLTRLSSKSQQAYAEAGSIAEQTIAQIRTVYSFVGETKAIKAYSEALKSTLKLGHKGGLAKGLGMGVSYALLFCSWALILWYAGVLVRRGETNGGKAVTAVFSVFVGGMSLGQAFSNFTAFGTGKAAGYRVLAMMRKEPKMSSNASGEILSEVRGDIEFCNVHFNYPSRPGAIIFKDFSLRIPAGKTVAIVGSSGSGKSTVMSLIERFYDPISGEVLLDGVDIRSLQLKWSREQMGLVNQEPALFATSIQENILYGKEDATLLDVEEASKLANAHGFISQLPDRYATQVGERGIQLSGGQKQRVAIARAMIRNPKILLLDEATSFLDAASEHVVQDALDHLMVGRTAVVVAHRLSTIRNANIIAVVQGGQIKEMGTHDELMAKGHNGAYSALVRLQELDMASDGRLLTHDSRHGSSGERRGYSRSSRRMPSIHSNSWRRLSSHSSSGSEGRFEFQEIDQKMEREVECISPRIPRGTFWKLVKLNAPEWPYAIGGIVGSVLCGFLNPIFALLISGMLSVFYSPNKDQIKREVQKIALVFIVTGFSAVGTFVLQHYYFGIMGENLTNRVREMMLTSIIRNEVGWFDWKENTSTQLAATLASDATNIQATIGDRVLLIVRNMTVLIAAVVIAFLVEWRMAIVLLTIFPIMVGAIIAQHLFIKGFSGDIQIAHARSSMISREAVSNIRTVAAFNAEGKVLQLLADELQVPGRRSLIRGNVAGFFFGLSQFAIFCSYALVLWYGSTLVKKGISSFGPVMRAFMVLTVTAFTVAETFSLTPDFVKGGQALLSVFSILDRKTLIDADDPDSERVASINGDIELWHVKFAYPARPEVCVFEDLNLKVQAGESLALVGTSGSGKSSVIALVERFYDPQAGRVMVDGKDIKKLNLKSLRQHIGLVQQEPALFMTSIYENILYGRDGMSEIEVEEAAKVGNAHGFISSLPEGYKTSVGERGVQLSGGQKQRIAIARAMLKNPGILLLDEATSALDAGSEQVVQEAVERVMRGRTTVLVAHRLSTVRNASRIAVIHEGRVVEQGSHEELLSSNKKDEGDGGFHSYYARLLNIQQWHYER